MMAVVVVVVARTQTQNPMDVRWQREIGEESIRNSNENQEKQRNNSNSNGRD